MCAQNAKARIESGRRRDGCFDVSRSSESGDSCVLCIVGSLHLDDRESTLVVQKGNHHSWRWRGLARCGGKSAELTAPDSPSSGPPRPSHRWERQWRSPLPR